MRFLAGWRLSLLLAVGAMAGAWVAVVLRRRRDVVRFTNVALLDVVAPRRPSWRRHVPPVLFLLALVALVLGFARPVHAVKVPDERAIIVLAVDTSLSMEADDVSPSRLAVAQQAARDFVDRLPEEIDVGLVSFNGVATVAVPPSGDGRQAVRAAIDGLQLGERTAIGEAIFASLTAIQEAPGGAEGEQAPGRIVLMSDGETTTGRPDQEAADAAAEAGVPVYTIAFGTPFGEIEIEGAAQPVPVAPGPLRQIADTTGGRAFEAASLPELTEVYQDIGSVVGFRDEDREVAEWFVGAGLLLLVAAGTASLVWSQRLP